MIYTIIIIAITALVSIAAFNDQGLRNKLILYPYAMNTPTEYYRLLTSGFIHGDWGHLAFNMLTLYFFGQNMEMVFGMISYKWVYVVLYVTGIIIASLPAFFKHKNHSYYMALGASGGVSAILFAAVYFDPWQGIQLMFIPVNIPGILFAVLYLVYSAYMSKRASDNIGHDAHLWGAVYGFVFAFVSDPTHGGILLEQLKHPTFN